MKPANQALPYITGKELLIGALVFSGLYMSSLYNFLLFHALTESFIAVVAFSIFIVAWNSRRISTNNYVLFLGISYFFIAVVEMLHSISYKGMGVFTGYGSNLPTQLWIAARYIEGASFLIAPFFIGRKLKAQDALVGWSIATSMLLISIFTGAFPDCYVEGSGLTPFKKASEYIISLMFVGSFLLVYKKRALFDGGVFRLIGLSLATAVVSELFFTFYISVYGISNLVGHYVKIISFYLLYKAFIETSLVRPYDFLFRDLKDREEGLKVSLDETRRRTREITALLGGARSILEKSEFRHSARAIFDNCKELTGATAGYIALLSADGMENEVLFLDAGGIPCTVDPSLPMPIRGLRGEAYRSGKVVYDNDFPNSRWLKFMPEGHADLENVLFAPLMNEGMAVGLMGIANKPGGFTEDDARMAAAFGELAAIALYNSRVLEHLEDSRERFRSVAQTATDAIITANGQGNIIFWNKGAEKMFGHSSVEIIGKPLTLIMPERFRQSHMSAIGKAASSGSTNLIGSTVEVVGLRKDLSEFPIELALASWKTKDGVFFSGIIRDITERKKAEEKLEKTVEERTAELMRTNEELEQEISAHRKVFIQLMESEEKFRNLMESAPVGVAISTPEGRLLDANPAMLEMFRYDSKEEFLGAPASFYYSEPADRDRFRDLLLRDGRVNSFEAQVKRKDGSRFPCLLNSIAQKAPDGSFRFINIVQDITLRKKMEEELVKAQKLESVGILAGGIAHDFNNALSAILTNISVAKMSVKPDDVTFRLLSNAEKASLRARNLTHQLLTFSKGGVPVKKTASIGELIRESAEFPLTGSSVKCEYSIPPGLLPVEIDEGQMNQVIQNLIINAKQAMPGGGLIAVGAKNISISDGEIPVLAGGNYVEVTIKDNGTGIPEENLPKIFDPYFTTKEGGSGLGLATTYSIISKHEGHILVDSKVGEGTTFKIYLRASEGRPPDIERAEKPVAGTAMGKVLVMDDEMNIRESLGAALSLFGYDVSYADDGEEAIQIYKRDMDSGSPFSAVILDLTIPGGMGGKETMEWLKEIDPGVKAIVSSGYSNDSVMSDYGRYGFKGVVVKPFQIEELVGELQRAIGG